MPDNYRIKLLAYGDSPTVQTGFAQVMRNILRILYQTGKYDITLIGINHDGSYYSREDYPYEIHPAISPLTPNPTYTEIFGRQKLLDFLGTGKYDILFTLQDTFIVKDVGPKIVETWQRLPNDRKFKWIYYFPIDAVPAKEWIDNSVLLADFPVVYTKYGYNECTKIYKVEKNTTRLAEDQQVLYEKQEKTLLKKLRVIYHGISTDDFYPLKEKQTELKIKYFGEKHKDSFIFINVNRNQQRKALDKSLMAFKMLKEKLISSNINKKIYLYLHCQVIDHYNLIEISKQVNLVQGDEWGFPNLRTFSAAFGFPHHILNELYNSCDCVFSTTLGEGFGLSIIEGMATKTITLLPNNTSIPELIGNNGERGIIYNSGNNRNLWVTYPQDNDRVRPLPDIEDLVEKMLWIITHPEEKKIIEEKAYDWIKDYDWNKQNVGGQWLRIFDLAYEQVKLERDMLTGKVNLGRNDICPICSVKFKKCKHYEKTQ